jgi:hypothetical protein
MQKGTSVIELINEPYAQAEYTFPFWKLGTLNELKYYVLFCPVVHDSDNFKLIGKYVRSNEKDYLVNQNVVVDISSLLRMLDKTMVIDSE